MVISKSNLEVKECNTLIYCAVAQCQCFTCLFKLRSRSVFTHFGL